MRIVVLAIGLWALSNASCSRTAPPAPSQAPPKAPPQIKVATIHGQVTRQTADGKKILLSAGDLLSAADIVRTEDGTATLEIGGVAAVEVATHTQVSIGELTDTLAKVHLSDGRIAAVVHGDEHNSLQIDSLGAVARANVGEFSMLSSGSQVSVAALHGQVTLSARGRSVRIGSGQLSLVARDQAPTPPEAIPASLYLKLGSTHPATQKERRAVLHGSTAPGAVISINGVRLNADNTGEFTATIALKEGPNHLVVDSADTLGRTAHAAWPRITVDTRAPEARSKVRW